MLLGTPALTSHTSFPVTPVIILTHLTSVLPAQPSMLTALLVQPLPLAQIVITSTSFQAELALAARVIVQPAPQPLSVLPVIPIISSSTMFASIAVSSI
jgi:hypothetical protein